MQRSLVLVSILVLLFVAACGPGEPAVEDVASAIPALETAEVATPAPLVETAAMEDATATPEATVEATATSETIVTPEATMEMTVTPEATMEMTVTPEATSGAGAPVTVEAGSFFFEPKQFTIPAGAATAVEVFNEADIAHTFTIRPLNIDVVLESGDRRTVTVNASAGEYQYICRFHPDRMTGTMTVK